MRDAVASSSFQQGTGSLPHSTAGSDAEDTGMMYRVGQAAMVLSGAALVALAARQGRWKTLGAAALAGAPLVYRGATGHWPVPQAVAQKASDALAPVPVETVVTINKPRTELYTFWRRLENLPRFMKNLDQVVDLGNGRSHWVGRSPLGLKAEWDAEIVDEREGRLLSWRSLPGSQVHNAGTVYFDDSPNGRGTAVRVSMELRGALGQAVGKAFGGVTEQQVREDLRRCKELMETGEIATTEGQPHGDRSLLGHIHNPI
ncbi:MAG: SRPBCC family protein [Thermoanaerobaculia bacterium]